MEDYRSYIHHLHHLTIDKHYQNTTAHTHIHTNARINLHYQHHSKSIPQLRSNKSHPIFTMNFTIPRQTELQLGTPIQPKPKKTYAPSVASTSSFASTITLLKEKLPYKKSSSSHSPMKKSKRAPLPKDPRSRKSLSFHGRLCVELIFVIALQRTAEAYRIMGELR